MFDDYLSIYIATFIIVCFAVYGPIYAIKKHLYHYNNGTKEISVKDCIKFIFQFLQFTVMYPLYYYRGKQEVFLISDNTTEILKKAISDRDHIDVIVIIYTGIYSYKNIAVFCSGIDLLLQKLGDHAIIHRCYTRDDVKKVITDSNNKKIWIFGHGRKYRLEFGDEFLYYEEMKDYPKKEYIMQFHCNPYGGKSLVDYLCEDPSKSVVTNGDVFAFENREYIINNA